jgi:hypothetical protein
MRIFAVLILLLASIAASAQTARTTAATEAELAQITERGRNLAAYDVAAWHGSDAVMRCSPPKEASCVTLRSEPVTVGPSRLGA